MAAQDPFQLRSSPVNSTGGVMGTLKNVGMFVVALVATVTMVTIFKAATASANGGHGGGRYYLEASQTLKVGDVLSPENSTWRASVGKKTKAFLTDDTKSSDRYWGWRVLAPVRAGKPIPGGNVVAMTQSTSLVSLAAGQVGFVLAGDELAAATELLRPGSMVNIIAVAGGTRKTAGMAPSVATLVESAKVLYVRPGVKRGGRGMDASVTIAVSADEAEDLAAWRQNGSLVLTLAGATPPDLSRLGQWREIAGATVEEEDAATDDSGDYDVSYTEDTSDTSADTIEVAGEYRQKGVAIITPNGAGRRPVEAGAPDAPSTPQ